MGYWGLNLSKPHAERAVPSLCAFWPWSEVSKKIRFERCKARKHLGLAVSEPADTQLCAFLRPAMSLHELCASRVSAILRDKVHRIDEVKEVEFYAFSYYYDLAANVGLIGKKDPLGLPSSSQPKGL